jgi:hypothetical protein
MPPIGRRKTPQRLDRRRKRQVGADGVEPDNPDKLRLARKLDGELAKAVLP